MNKKLITLVIIFFFAFIANGFSQTWNYIGTGYQTSDPYPFYYYKLAQINNSNDRYASIIELSVQSDANYFDQQATYTIRIDKYEGTNVGSSDGARFDGMEIRCTSGNPAAAVFFISGTGLWVRSNNRWGGLYYRVIANFVQSPIVPDIAATQTLSGPSNVLYYTNQNGIKCDFDHNRFYEIPAIDVHGSVFHGLNINSQLNNQMGRPPVGANTIPGEIRGISGDDPLADDGLLRLSAGGGTNSGTKSYIDISGYMADPSNERLDNIVFGTRGLERMRLDLNGNLGIGVNDTKGYKLAVNGKIRTKEIKVEASDWPDYVFNAAHEMPSLRELETFIRENHHLPDIPSASETAEDGIDLGKMNTRLLKKIEELTLYIIEQEKRIQKLEDAK